MNDHDDLTRTLSRELDDRAHEMDGALLHLADVQGKARSIRRRRTATAVAGVAAAVALIVPTVALASHTNGRPEPLPPVTQVPTQSPTDTATDDGSQPAPGVMDVSDLPTGSAPHIEYLDGNVLHQLDGSTIDVATKYPISSFTVLSDGTHLWQTADNGTPYVEVQDAEGNLQAPVPSGWGVGVNHNHTVAAWVRPDGQVMVRNSGATEPLAYGDPISPSDDMRMGPVLGDHCGAPQDACEVYVNVSDPQAEPSWQPWLVDVNGTGTYTDGTYLIYADASEDGLGIGYRSLSDFGSCSVLLGGGEFQGFRTCQHTLASFSPDGRLILGTPAYGDGPGSGEIAMLDLEGNVLFNRHSTAKAQAYYPSAEWEDAEHVLGVFFQDGKWQIVRVASDGSMEYAVAPVSGQDAESPFILATGGPVLAD
jgi:hypothetical protein